MTGVEFVKGHGTENDFVLLPDADGELDLTDTRVRALCDRQRGLGADGVLRVIASSVAARVLPDVDLSSSAATWFMDYRNADGSVAEMCGNGVRVFARYLVDAGLAEPGELVVGTRAGDRPVVTHEDGNVTVDMGPATVTGRSVATLDGQSFPGVVVDVGNPHLACLLDGVDLAKLDLSTPPGHDPAVFPHGANIEFLLQPSAGQLEMRVHERGVGETRSCGTGTVAAAAAALHLGGRSTGESVVRIPGGEVVVWIGAHTSTLTGPAMLVARGQLDYRWWVAHA